MNMIRVVTCCALLLVQFLSCSGLALQANMYADLGKDVGKYEAEFGLLEDDEDDSSTLPVSVHCIFPPWIK